MKHSIPFLLCSAACLLLFPSCVKWNIGENILTAAETHVALDYTRPVDGQLYRVSRPGQDARYYARLPEVRYRVMPDVVRLDMYDFKGYTACGIEPTGREAFAEVTLDWYSAPRQPEKQAIKGLLREVEALPASALAMPYSPARPEPLSASTPAKCEEETAPGFTRRAVASALTYTIDPVLTFASTTAFCVGEVALVIAVGPFACVYYALAPESECDSHRQSPTPPAPAEP